MIAGEAGVGKSRLAAQALAGFERYAVIRALGTETAAMIPFGAFAHVLTGPPAGGENLLHWAERHLLDRAGQRELLVSVDDAHRLDPASAALVHHLAQCGTARVLVTVSSGTPQPAPVAALWKDELLDRIELPPLDVAEVGQVLAGALGGEVAAATVRRLAAVSGGNVLYLREVVYAGRAAGRLTEADGQWRWQGELSVTTRLRELVGARIGHLAQDEREVLELVAFGEPIGTALLMSLVPPGAVERVEDRGLVATVQDHGRESLRLGHPLYGEVVRGGCGTLRTRRRLRTLAEALEASGLRRREDVLRAAVWRLDSGSTADPELLLAAANLAWTRHDPRLAARLASAAADAGAGTEAVALHGEVLMVLGEKEPALAALRQAARGAVTESQRVRHTSNLGLNLARAGADAEACRVLDAAVEGPADPVWRQQAHLFRGTADFLAGRLTEARRSLARARAPMTAGNAAQAAALEAWVDAYAGRTEAALTVARQALDGIGGWRDEAPHAVSALLDARCAAYAFSGNLVAAARAAEAGMGLTAAAEQAVGGFGAHRALVSRLRGEAEAAVRWCREDAVQRPARTPYLGRRLAELAHASALLGRTTAARAALAQAMELVGRWAFTRQPALQAAAWVAAAAGDLDGAVRACLSAAEWADRHEQGGYLMFALHDLVRLGAPELAADRLAALAQRMDGPLVRLCARHAAAGGDAGEHRAVAAEFERMGMVLFAAEATAHEAAAHRAAGRGTLAGGARSRAWALARRCPGVSTPALVELAAPELTPRQREIVQLAAAGLTNRQIAARLTMSTRTAANHLQAAYDRLGVNNRVEAGRLLTVL